MTYLRHSNCRVSLLVITGCEWGNDKGLTSFVCVFVLWDIPAKCPGRLLKFYRGCIFQKFHRDRFFSPGYIFAEVWEWPGMLNLWAGIPTGKIFYRGFPHWLVFTGVEAGGELGRDVLSKCPRARKCAVRKCVKFHGTFQPINQWYVGN